MIGLKNATPEEFEELYVKYGIGGSMDLSIPTFYFSLVMEENIKSNKNIYTHLIIRYLLLRCLILSNVRLTFIF